MKKRVALLTDFGTRDYYVGVLKGVIAKIAPDTEVLDITHGIPPYSLNAGAFGLDKSYRFFPEGTVFLVVVDPGVGSTRRILTVESGGYTFVAPDNGVLTPVLSRGDAVVKEIRNCDFYLIEGASTFEARDKMAPLAAAITIGADISNYSTDCLDPIIIDDYFPVVEELGIKGKVLYIDQFGNIITSIPEGMIKISEGKESCISIKIGDRVISLWEKSYSQGGDEAFLIFGSHGNLEISMNMKSAAQKLGVSAEDRIFIEFSCRTS